MGDKSRQAPNTNAICMTSNGIMYRGYNDMNVSDFLGIKRPIEKFHHLSMDENIKKQ